MTEPDLTPYQPLVEEAIRAFRLDPAYATEMARQAGISRSRQEARRERDLLSASAA